LRTRLKQTESVNGQKQERHDSKQFVALKEARETQYWLRLIAVSEPSFKPTADPLIAEASEFVAVRFPSSFFLLPF